MNNLYQFHYLSLIQWIGVFIFLSLISYKAKFLSRSGVIAALGIGSIIIATGENWLYPLILFFTLSSILTRFSSYYKKTAKPESIPRTASQVLGNGAVAALSAAGYLLYPDPALIIFFLGSVAAATSDTWSTEIGAFSRTQPRLLTTFQPVERGRSGGITFIGIAGGIIGSAALAVSGLYIFDGESGLFYLESGVISVFIGGIAGNLFDSLLGVTLQSKNRCVVCDKITEEKLHCGKPTIYSSGSPLLNNDSVNFLCTLVGGFSAVIVWLLYS